MNEKQTIVQKLEERKELLWSFKKKISKVELEINLLEEVLAVWEDKPQASFVERKTKGNRGRRLDIKWKDVLCFMAERQSVSTDEIMMFAQKNEYNITLSSLRVQLNSYNKKDWVHRVGTGVYAITEFGIEKCGYKRIEPPTALATEGSNFEQESNSNTTLSKFASGSLGTTRRMRPQY